MQGASEWLNKNPKLALAIVGGTILVLAIGLLLYFKSSGSSGAATATTPGTTAGTTAGSTAGGTAEASNPAAGGYPAMGAAGGGYPAAGGGSGLGGAVPDTGAAGGSSDTENLVKGKRPRLPGRANPMEPLWRPVPPVIRFVPPPPPPIFTPPTPPVFVASRPPSEQTGSRALASAAMFQGPERMAGILYNNDRVVAVVERNSPLEGAQSYVVQPGDPVGRDGKVVAISPDSVTVRYTDGHEATVPLQKSTLLGLPPASSLSSGGYNPYGAAGVGMPGMGGGYPGMGGGYPGMGGMSGMGGGYPGMGGGMGMPPV